VKAWRCPLEKDGGRQGRQAVRFVIFLFVRVNKKKWRSLRNRSVATEWATNIFLFTRGAPTAEMAAVPVLLGGLGCMNPIDRTEEAVVCVVASGLPAISSLSTNPCHQRKWQRENESIPVESWRMPGVVSRLSRQAGRWQREGGAFERPRLVGGWQHEGGAFGRPSFCLSGPRPPVGFNKVQKL